MAVAVLPLALSRLLRRDAREPEQALGSVVVALTAWTLASVATLSASAYGLGRLHERSLFYVVPLIVVCLVYWLAEGMPRPPWLVWLVAGIAVALPLLLPERFIRGSPTPDALATVPWEKLARHWPSVPTPLLLAPLVVLAAISFVAGRTRLLAIAWLLLAFVVVGVVHARNRGFQPANVSKLAWIDTTLPKNGKATVVYVAPEGTCPGETRIGSSQLLVTFTEFFNTTVDRVVNLGGQVVLDGLLSDSLTLRADGVVLDRGHPIAPSNVALDSHIRVDGRRLVVLDPHSPSSMTLWAVRPPLRFVGYHRAPPTCSRPS